MTAANRVRCTSFLLLLLTLLAAPLAAQAQSSSTIAQARSQGAGATVTVEGVVTRAFDSFVRIQDQSGATGASALVIRQTSGAFQSDIQDGTIESGTRLEVTGTLSLFNGLLQINNDDLASYDVLGTTDVPAPQDVTLAEIQDNGGDYESELVRITNTRITGADGGTFTSNESYNVTDGTATVVLRVQGDDQTALVGEPIPDGAFTYTGVVGVYFPNFFDSPDYQLIPIRTSDLQETASVFFAGRPYTLAYETGGEATVEIPVRASGLSDGQSATVSVSTAGSGEASDVSGLGDLTFNGDGTQTLSLTADDDGMEEGIEQLILTLSTDANGVAASAGRFSVWILDDPAAQTTLFAGLEGAELRNRLRETFASGAGSAQPGPPTLGYDTARDTLYGVVFNDGGIVRGFYTGYEAPLGSGDPSSAMSDADVNAEHLWPRSKGAQNEPALSNMHILAPAWATANSARSNYPYDEIDDAQTDRWFGANGSNGVVLTTAPPEDERDAYSEVVGGGYGSGDFNGYFEPREMMEGNAARKAFYFVMAYPGRADLNFFEAQRTTLRRWNAADPVDAAEQRRNVLIASYQGDELNPFQLDSTLARRAFFVEEENEGGVLTIAEARERLNGTVTVEGIFTRLEGSNARIQDTSGPTGASGIVVRDGTLRTAIENGDVNPGDRLRVTGPLGDFNGLRQLDDGLDSGSVSYEVIEAGAGLPPVQNVSVGELVANGENYESELVRVDRITVNPDGDEVFQAGGGAGNYTVTGPSGDAITLRIPGSSFYGGQPIPEGEVTFQGVVGQFGTGGPGNGYQLTAIDAGDLQQGSDGDAIIVNVTRTFGDPDAQTGYRLVALPGMVNRPLDETIDGANGSAWQAYWDDGSAEDYFVQWDGSATFDFRPGRGFWLIANDAWTVQASIPPVETAADGSYAIDLHDGWNIISNPLADGVAWSAVESANGGMLQPLWSFDGSYMQASTFVTAATGEAFYFFNSDDRAELTIPAPSGNAAALAAAGTAPSDGILALSTYRDGQRTSTARVGTAEGATDGLDAHDAFAPPGYFEAASLRLPLPGASADGRAQQLAGERRAPGQNGYAFDLVLTAAPGAPVMLRASGLPTAFDGQAVVLVDPARGARYDLRENATVELTPAAEATSLRLLVGTAALAEGEQPLPEEVTLRPGYPNPFTQGVTLEYELPEATDVRVAVYDLLGRRVRTLVDERQEAGTHPLQWDGEGAGGAPMASGVYFVRLTAGGVTRSEKVVRVR